MSKKIRHTPLHFVIVLLLTWTIKLAWAIVFLGVALLGCLLYFRLLYPINWVVAIALVGIGLTKALMSLWEMGVSLVSWDYGRTHCPFCQPSTDPKKILSLKNGRPGS
jgi:hypothetical protein